jgi:uncharacterized protein
METDEGKGTPDSASTPTTGGADPGSEDNVQAENTLGALIRIASRLESTPAVHEETAKQGKRRRFGELAAMAAVVLAASAVGVALWGQTPAKASSGSPAVKAAPKNATCNGSSAKLTVQGTGIAIGTPDQMTLVAEIDVTQTTAQAALAIDNVQATEVERALIADGVTGKNIQTSNLSIQPNYGTVNNNVVLTGYSVSDTVSANFETPFSKAGKAIDDITAIGGDDIRIDSLSFSFADPRTLEDQARTNAVVQAVGHAQSMATAAGEKLGPICSVTDDSSVEPTPVQYDNNLAYASPAMAETPTPVQAGSQQETDQVTVVYALQAAAGS